MSAREVKPVTMKGYIIGIERFLSEEWAFNIKLSEGPKFICSKQGLMAVIDKNFSLQQAMVRLLRVTISCPPRIWKSCTTLQVYHRIRLNVFKLELLSTLP